MTTPHFRNPPVVETVLGVQFPPLAEMRITHYGLLWQRFKDELPKVSELPALDPATESFDEDDHHPMPRWRIQSGPPMPRCWFASRDDTRLIQVQPDRLLFNWRRQTEQDTYPQYDTNRDRFLAAYASFCEFVDEHDLGPLAPKQCEVTYVNHIEIAEGCNAAGMLARVLVGWSAETSDGWLKGSESGAYRATFAMPDRSGRLHASAKSVIRLSDQKKMIQFNLTARCALESPDRDGIQRGLSCGHEWVVRGFKSLTTPEMHKFWDEVQ